MKLRLDEYIEAPSLPGFTPYSIYIIEVNNQEVGRIVWRLGNDEEHYYDGHIGYHIEEEYRGHYYAYQACLLLKDQIIKDGYDHVLLTCDPDNIASRKTIEKLGAIFIERKEIPRTLRKMFSKDERVKNIYRWEMKS